jgi:cytochrome c
MFKFAPALIALSPLALIVASAAQAAPPPATFARCAVCHNAEKGAPDKIGPNLYGVVGRKAAHTKFAYTEALKKSGLTWSEAELDKWISAPMQMVPGTAMAFPGIKDPAKRAEVIAYLKTLK